ncbi:hypothetical protein ACFL5V_11215 [Fibrobacterota bacterium]
MPKKTAIFCLSLLGFLTAAIPGEETPSVPQARAEELNPIVTVHISLLGAVQESAILSSTLTAFKPFEFGLGVFDGVSRTGYFMKLGYAVPWRESEYDLGPGMTREIVVFGGFRHVEPGTYSYESGRNFNAVTMEMGLDAVEWLNPFFGISLHLSLGINYWLTEWKGKPDMEPLMDVSIGIAL